MLLTSRSVQVGLKTQQAQKEQAMEQHFVDMYAGRTSNRNRGLKRRSNMTLVSQPYFGNADKVDALVVVGTIVGVIAGLLLGA